MPHRVPHIRRILPLPAILLAVVLTVSSVLAADTNPPASQEAVAAYREALTDWEAGRQDQAISGFRHAADLAPDWGAPNARLGVIYQLQGQETESRAQYALAQTASMPKPGQLCDEELKLRKLIIDGEAQLIYLTNAARLENGLPVVVPDPTVDVVARRHSEEMRDKNYFSHESPTQGMTSCQDRFRAVFGYKPRLIAENVARRWGSMFCLCEEKLLDTHHDLMNSPGHRHNILYPTVEWLGLGIAANSNGDYWVTEVFVQPGR